jgi:hypothetical protein
MLKQIPEQIKNYSHQRTVLKKTKIPELLPNTISLQKKQSL